MKKILSARALTINKRTSFSSSSCSMMIDAATQEIPAITSAMKETGAHHGKMRVAAASSDTPNEKAYIVQDVVFSIGASGVSAAEVDGEVLFEAQYELLKEIVWNHSEKSLKFVLLDGHVSASFVFTTLSLVRCVLFAETALCQVV